MHLRHWPPGRTSISSATTVSPSGAHHRIACWGSVQAPYTMSRGASKRRVMTSSRSAASAAALGLALLAAIFLLLLQLAQIVVEAVEALLPEAAIMLDPARHVLERSGLEPAWPPLRLAAARDEAGALQHLEVLGDGGHAHLERLGQLGDRGLAQGEPRQDGAPRRVGERREGAAEAVGRHGVSRRSRGSRQRRAPPRNGRGDAPNPSDCGAARSPRGPWACGRGRNTCRARPRRRA